MNLLSQKEIEAEFPIVKKYCYLNSASTGILPNRSIREMERFLRRYSGNGINHDAESFRMFDSLRELLSELLGAPPERLALTFNTSHGINIAATGLPIEPGDVIVLPPDEFPANFYPWQAQRRRGAKLLVAEKASEEALDIPKTKIIALSWVRFFDGLRFDLNQCVRIAQKNDAFVCVDGIQGAGVLRINLDESAVHTFSAGGQKWLLSPYGTGVFYVRNGVPLEPCFTGWLCRFQSNGDYTSLRRYDIPTPIDARKFEMGTPPYHNLWAMFRSVQFLKNIGIEKIEKYTTSLAEKFAIGAEAMDIEVVTPRKQLPSPIVSIRHPDAEKIHSHLLERKIICSLREGLLRFSFHIYNTPADVEKALSSMKECIH